MPFSSLEKKNRCFFATYENEDCVWRLETLCKIKKSQCNVNSSNYVHYCCVLFSTLGAELSNLVWEICFINGVRKRIEMRSDIWCTLLIQVPNPWDARKQRVRKWVWYNNRKKRLGEWRWSIPWVGSRNQQPGRAGHRVIHRDGLPGCRSTFRAHRAIWGWRTWVWNQRVRVYMEKKTFFTVLINVSLLVECKTSAKSSLKEHLQKSCPVALRPQLLDICSCSFSF